MVTPARTRVALPEISSRAWEHPADRGALVALRKLRGFDSVLKAVNGLISERVTRLMLLGDAVRVDERQFPRMHYMLMDAGRVLDAKQLPELYVTTDPTVNAMTIGMERPMILLNSALVELLDDEELRFAIAHELGHALSGHAVYRTLLLRLMQFSGLWSAIPLGALGIRVIIAALMEWSRKAELSADRAGLLVSQDPAAVLRAHMKMAGGVQLDELDPASFLAQGAEYSEAGDVRDSILKLFLLEQRSHPMAVVRATEARRWVDSGAYAKILTGDYPRRSGDADAKISDAAREAAEHYSESFARAGDALSKLLKDVGGAVGGALNWLGDKLQGKGKDGTA